MTLNSIFDIIGSGTLTMVAAAVTAIMLGTAFRRAFPFLIETERKDNDKRNKLHQNVLDKLKNGIQLNLQDIIDIGRGLGVAKGDCVEVIYSIFAETKDDKNIVAIRHLIAESKKRAPYEDVPEEAKASILRIAELCDNSEK